MCGWLAIRTLCEKFLFLFVSAKVCKLQCLVAWKWQLVVGGCVCQGVPCVIVCVGVRHAYRHLAPSFLCLHSSLCVSSCRMSVPSLFPCWVVDAVVTMPVLLGRVCFWVLCFHEVGWVCFTLLDTVETSIGAKTQSDPFSHWLSATPLWLIDLDCFGLGLLLVFWFACIPPSYWDAGNGRLVMCPGFAVLCRRCVNAVHGWL